MSFATAIKWCGVIILVATIAGTIWVGYLAVTLKHTPHHFPLPEYTQQV